MAYTNPNAAESARIIRARRVDALGWTTTVRAASVGDGWVVEIVDRSLSRVGIALGIDLTDTMDRAWDEALADGPQFANACRYCGNDITSLRADARFCGVACRVANNRRVRRAAQSGVGRQVAR